MISQVPDMYPHEQLKVHSAVVGGGNGVCQWLVVVVDGSSLWQLGVVKVGSSGEKLFKMFLLQRS